MDNIPLLRAASQGDISQLYNLIEANPNILELVDDTPFVQTPLHIAAKAGRLQFATEIMSLKPTFALKLNPEGFSPLHLALQQQIDLQNRLQERLDLEERRALEKLLDSQKRMVLRFINISKDLVRVQGKEGITPLHFVSQSLQTETLSNFLSVCPESIEDVTIRGETALHLAINNNQYQALQVLVSWLKITRHKGAMDLEENILNQKDEAGNTILHIAAYKSYSEALGLLLNTEIDINAKNLDKFTALDLATSAAIRDILKRAGAKIGSSVPDAPNRNHDILRSEITNFDTIIIYILRIREDISEPQRNAFLVVATLLATATSQVAFSPLGGVYQANAGANDQNTTTLNSTTKATQGNVVIAGESFLILSLFSTFSFLISTIIICVLTPRGTVGKLLYFSLFLLAYWYLFAMVVISPTSATQWTNWILWFLYTILYIVLCLALALKRERYEALRSAGKANKIIRGSY